MGLGVKVVRALENAGATREEMNALAEDHTALRGALGVLRGSHSFAPPHHLVDMDGPPVLRWHYRFDVEDQPLHRLHGLIDLGDVARIKLVMGARQRDGDDSAAHIREDLGSETVLGAQALEYFLQHQELLPEAWRHHRIFFWGTILRNGMSDEDGPLVQYMYYEYKKSRWEYGVVSAKSRLIDLMVNCRAAVYRV